MNHPALRNSHEVRILLTDNSNISLMIEGPCDQPNRLLEDVDELIHDDKASTIFTLFCIFLVFSCLDKNVV